MDEKQVLARRRVIEFGGAYAYAKRREVYQKWKKVYDQRNRAERMNKASYYDLAEETERLSKELTTFDGYISESSKWLAEYDTQHQLTGFSFDDVAPNVCQMLGYIVEGITPDYVSVTDTNGNTFNLSRHTVEGWVIDYRHKVNLREPASDEVDV